MSFRDMSKTEELLELYEEEDLLWNTSHEHYYRKSKRKQALNRISSMLGIPVSQITKKITNLRTYYCKELNKIKQSKAKGDEQYVSKWDHFKNMDRFLYPYIQGRKLVEVCDEDDSDDPDDQDEHGATNGSQSLKQEDSENTANKDGNTASSVRKRKYQEEDSLQSESRNCVSLTERLHRICQGQSEDLNHKNLHNDSNVRISQSLSQSKTLRHTPVEDREDVFGKHVANELRLIQDLRTRQLAKLKIQNILFEAQFGGKPDVSSKISSSSLNLMFPDPPSIEENHVQSEMDSSNNTESADVVVQNGE